MTVGRTTVSLMVVVLLAGGCASTGAKQPKGAQEQTARQAAQADALGVVGADTPDLLVEVRAAPYAPPKAVDCASIALEITALDVVLGPDVDADEVKDDAVGGFVTDAVRGFIPYRGVMRFLAGASKRDKALARAVLAGTARRGFLKGISRTMGCAPPA
jgi:hypothetical protein